MPSKILKKYLPEPAKLKQDKNLQILGGWLHDPNIWHLNRRSVSGGFAVGLAMAFMPFPFGQTLAAALLAIFFRVNLPLSAALVWITNPITMPPIYLAALQLGNLMLGTSLAEQEFHFSVHWVTNHLGDIWKPFVLGCLTLSTVSAVLGYFTALWIWRRSVARKYSHRKSSQRRCDKSKL